MFPSAEEGYVRARIQQEQVSSSEQRAVVGLLERS
jgi:hypothetical protein